MLSHAPGVGLRGPQLSGGGHGGGISPLGDFKGGNVSSRGGGSGEGGPGLSETWPFMTQNWG